MQLGVIGLGRMGANITRRLMADGHRAIVYDIDAAAVARLDGEGATGAGCYAELVAKLDRPRSIWVMVPAGLVDRVLAELTPLLHDDDVVIDGGNSFYRDDVARAAALAPLGVHYVDVGTSGGVFGLERGFCLMIGGEPVVVERLDAIFATLAPGAGAAPRTPGKFANQLLSAMRAQFGGHAELPGEESA